MEWLAVVGDENVNFTEVGTQDFDLRICSTGALPTAKFLL
jgi:hypothetical protein